MNEAHSVLTDHILIDPLLHQLNLLKSMPIDFFELINGFFLVLPRGGVLMDSGWLRRRQCAGRGRKTKPHTEWTVPEWSKAGCKWKEVWITRECSGARWLLGQIVSVSLSLGKICIFRLFSCFSSALRMALLREFEDGPLEGIMELSTTEITGGFVDQRNFSAGVCPELRIHQSSEWPVNGKPTFA